MAQDMNEATRVMGVGGSTTAADKTVVAGGHIPAGFVGGAGATQMGGTTVCAVCRTTNSAMETFCSECGFLLASTPGQLDGAGPDAGPTYELVDPVSGIRHPLHAGENTVGRERTDILLMDSTVSRRHAKVTIDNGLVILMDLGSSNGTTLDTTRLGPNQPVPVPSGATMKFGNATLQLVVTGEPARPPAGALPPAPDVSAPAVEAAPRLALPGADTAVPPGAAAEAPAPPFSPPPPASSAGQAVAQLRPKSTGAETIYVTMGTMSIGRRNSNDVVITGDPYISGKHAEILCDATGCYLIDAGSTNGTVVNGEKLEAGRKQLLLDGDEVKLGQCNYLFETLEAPA